MAARQKASALFYAVVVALLLGMIVGGMIMLTHHRSVLVERWIGHERVASNARSAAHLAFDLVRTEGEEVRSDLYGTGHDSVSVRYMAWGGLDLVYAKAWYGGLAGKVSALAGRVFDDRVVLDLSRRAGPLHLCGDSRIQGDVRVPQADVRRGHIEGRPFSGEELVDGLVMKSLDPPATLRGELADRLQRLCSGMGYAFEVEFGHQLEMRERWNGDPELPLPVLSFAGPTHLTDLTLRGPLILRCTDSLSLSGTVSLDLVIVQAPSITIAPGARLSAQFFASKVIHVGAGAQLLFPSLLAVWRDDHSAMAAHIKVEEDALVQGAVILIDRSIRERAFGGLFIAERAAVQGEVFVEGGVQHQGDLTGTMSAQEMVLRTPASIYHGHLLDGRIHRYGSGVPRGFGCTAESNERTIIQWVDQ